MLKEIIATCLLSGSIGSKSFVPVTVPFHDDTHYSLNDEVIYSDTSTKNIKGTYNFRDVIDVDELYEEMSRRNIGSIDFDIQVDLFPPSGGTGMPYLGYMVPISYNNVSYFVYEIDFEAIVDDYCNITFKYYDMVGYYQYGSVAFSVPYGVIDLSSLTWQKEFIIDIKNTIVLSDYSHLIFDTCLTTDRNAYIVDYSGYFSFFDISTYGVPFTVFGNELFDSRNYYDLYTTGNYPQDVFIMSYRDILETPYVYHLYNVDCDLEYNTKQFLVNWRMSETSYNNMESIGYFGFIRDTSFDDTTFKDLIFTLVDSPIYMVSSILSFELFGVNLFIALTGLLTLMVILVLVKKFW